MYSTPHFRSRDILATSFMHPPLTTSLVEPHFTQDVAPHFTCSQLASVHHSQSDCDQSHPAIPHPTTDCVSHKIPHYPVHHHILHPTTDTHNTLLRPTFYLIPHHTTSTFGPFHSTCTNPYYTTTFHNPIPVSEARNYDVIRFVISFIYIYNLLCHTSNPNKNGGEKVQLYSGKKYQFAQTLFCSVAVF